MFKAALKFIFAIPNITPMEENYLYPQKPVHRTHAHYSPNLLSILDHAVEVSKVVSIEYESFEKGITKRDVEPMAVVFKDRKRHLVAWCRLRNSYRSFRLDRLNCVKLTTEGFTPRKDFNIEEFKDRSRGPYEKEFEEVN